MSEKQVFIKNILFKILDLKIKFKFQVKISNLHYYISFKSY
mgnify:CR=1 FL=1